MHVWRSLENYGALDIEMKESVTYNVRLLYITESVISQNDEKKTVSSYVKSIKIMEKNDVTTPTA